MGEVDIKTLTVSDAISVPQPVSKVQPLNGLEATLPLVF